MSTSRFNDYAGIEKEWVLFCVEKIAPIIAKWFIDWYSESKKSKKLSQDQIFIEILDSIDKWDNKKWNHYSKKLKKSFNLTKEAIRHACLARIYKLTSMRIGVLDETDRNLSIQTKIPSVTSFLKLYMVNLKNDYRNEYLYLFNQNNKKELIVVAKQILSETLFKMISHEDVLYSYMKKNRGKSTFAVENDDNDTGENASHHSNEDEKVFILNSESESGSDSQ